MRCALLPMSHGVRPRAGYDQSGTRGNVAKGAVSNRAKRGAGGEAGGEEMKLATRILNRVLAGFLFGLVSVVAIGEAAGAQLAWYGVLWVGMIGGLASAWVMDCVEKKD